MRTPIRALLILLLTLDGTTAARAAPTTVVWYGHAAFQITTPKGKVLMIDPWLNNPKNPAAWDNKDPLAAIDKVDYILITHAHFDHIGDAVALAKKTGARLVTSSDLGKNMEKLLGYPSEQMGYDTLMNIGGEIVIADGEVMVALTPAVHSSGMGNPNAGEGEPAVAYGGNPTGIVLRIQDGPTLYHTGDTAYFSDMKLIGEQYAPDLALINIGGHFGMEPDMAVKAAIAVKARIVAPHHYGTFPFLNQDPTAFARGVQNAGIDYVALRPGVGIQFEGRKLVVPGPPPK